MWGDQQEAASAVCVAPPHAPPLYWAQVGNAQEEVSLGHPNSQPKWDRPSPLRALLRWCQRGHCGQEACKCFGANRDISAGFALAKEETWGGAQTTEPSQISLSTDFPVMPAWGPHNLVPQWELGTAVGALGS